MGRLPESTSLGLHAEAARRALDDAGMGLNDVDGVLTVGSLTDPWPHHSGALCEYLGLRPAYTDTVCQGGAGNCTMVQLAAMLVTSGICRTVLAVGADNQLSGMSRDAAVAAFARNRHPEFEFPLGLSTPAGYALMAQRHCHEYGTSREDLARVAVTCRENAARHPGAQLDKPLSLEEALASKPIAEPLHMTDCCLSSDGGGAVIVTGAERAPDLPRDPVYLLGAGQGFEQEHICRATDLTTSGAGRAAATAYAMAGLGPGDVDVAQFYDCFTITVLIQLEAYGFCPQGESGGFVRDGHIGRGGSLPINTGGGMLAYGNPGISGGIIHVVEAVHQLRGTAGERQIDGAEVALVTGVGAVLSHTSALLLGKTP